MAFMLESRYVIQPTQWAMETELRQRDYTSCWDGIKRNFNGTNTRDDNDETSQLEIRPRRQTGRGQP